MLFDNIFLSTSGNQPPMGGGNPQPPILPASAGGTTAMPSVLLDQDVEPIQAQHLRTVHSKLSQLYTGAENSSPNRGLTMNSPRLINLQFTNVDRSTMENHIKYVYPNMRHRFRTTNKGYSYSDKITSEILDLFKPDTLT
jgi:hypothetical protein